MDGTGLRRLTHNRGQDAEPAWAPNGKRIAWSFGATAAGSTSGIYTMSPDGSAKRFRGAGLAPDWSPDGQRFVFALDGDLWTSTVAGAEREPLAMAPASTRVRSGRRTGRRSRSSRARGARPTSTGSGGSTSAGRTGAC